MASSNEQFAQDIRDVFWFLEHRELFAGFFEVQLSTFYSFRRTFACMESSIYFKIAETSKPSLVLLV